VKCLCAQFMRCILQKLVVTQHILCMNCVWWISCTAAVTNQVWKVIPAVSKLQHTRHHSFQQSCSVLIYNEHFILSVSWQLLKGNCLVDLCTVNLSAGTILHYPQNFKFNVNVTSFSFPQHNIHRRKCVYL